MSSEWPVSSLEDAHRRLVTRLSDVGRGSRLADYAVSSADALSDPESRIDDGACSCGLLLGRLVLLALSFRILLHVAVLTETLRIFGLVRAALGAFLPAELEVAIGTHTFGIVLLVGVAALGDDVLLANHRLLALRALRAASWPFLANQLGVNRRFCGMLEVLRTRCVPDFFQVGHLQARLSFLDLDRLVVTHVILVVRSDLILHELDFLGLWIECLLVAWSREALVWMLIAG